MRNKNISMSTSIIDNRIIYCYLFETLQDLLERLLSNNISKEDYLRALNYLSNEYLSERFRHIKITKGKVKEFQKWIDSYKQYLLYNI